RPARHALARRSRPSNPPADERARGERLFGARRHARPIGTRRTPGGDRDGGGRRTVFPLSAPQTGGPRAVIDVRNLGVSFGDVDALGDVNLTVESGELVGLVGPNGAGKSTLLGAINGLVEPTAGTVEIDGENVRELSAQALARRVATVPQETDLSFAFPVREVVTMGRTPYRSRFERVSPTDRAHTRRAMERTD